MPESILESNPKEILRYYYESRSDQGKPLQEFKLILVGRGKSGKTTLIKQLAGEKPDRNEPETHSISIRQLTFECQKGSVRSRAWDFGGQEILHSTHQFFLTERSLYLLVLEPRVGMAQKDAEYWLKLIELQGAASPVIVVLNWSRGRNWRIDQVKLRRKFPFIVDFVSTDALYGDGILNLKNLIVKIVQEQMPDVWLPFPIHWRKIKYEVAGMKTNFLTYDQYTQLCESLGEKRKDAQADLAGILNSLGLVLYFGKDPRLHDTRVLNPGWVTGGVYAVIRSEFVGQKEGQLSLSDMPWILKEAHEKNVIAISDYRPETHEFILELMRAFQLSYSDQDEHGNPTIYLVPELLPEFEPEMEEQWDSAKVRLRYRYPALPTGLLSRFIVQTHALSEGAPHWRHGVVLRHADAKALIRQETDSLELQVFVIGNEKETRNVLVSIVRRELELLHSSLKMQSIEELELTGESNQWLSVKSLKEVEEPGKLIQKVAVQPEGTAEVNIALELDKIIPTEVRAIERGDSETPLSVKLFVSYAHDDLPLLKRLDAMLDVLEQQHGLTSWRDQERLIAGDQWEEQIRERLEDMDIFLFIASAKSIVRPFIRDVELKRAIERKKQNQIEIVTVKLEACACDDDPDLGKLQRLAPRFTNIVETNPRSKAWEQVRKDLLPVIERVRKAKGK